MKLRNYNFGINFVKNLIPQLNDEMESKGIDLHFFENVGFSVKDEYKNTYLLFVASYRNMPTSSNFVYDKRTRSYFDSIDFLIRIDYDIAVNKDEKKMSFNFIFKNYLKKLIFEFLLIKYDREAIIDFRDRMEKQAGGVTITSIKNSMNNTEWYGFYSSYQKDHSICSQKNYKKKKKYHND